jgi:hypothetical protein
LAEKETCRILEFFKNILELFEEDGSFFWRILKKIKYLGDFFLENILRILKILKIF